MKKVAPGLIISNIIICLLCFSTQVQAQESKDTVYITSSEIKKMINDKYYVRVPNSDLEQRLQDKVTGAVNNKFNFIYGLIGVLSFLIGGILLFNLRSVVGSRIDKELTEKHIPAVYAKLNDHINNTKEVIKDNFRDLEISLDLRMENFFLKNFKANIDDAIAKLKQEQEKAVEAMKLLNEIKFDRLRSNVESRQDLLNTMNGLKELLAQADKNNDVVMISRVLNELSYVTFYLKKDAEYEKMIDAYADRTDVDINEASFVNAALGCLYDYQDIGELPQREKALRYINKALRKTSDYGEALGLKLELFMTDFDNAIDTERKEKAQKEAEKLIDFINSKDIAAYETLARFKRVQASSAKSKYIDLVYQTFPGEMKKMEGIADAYKAKQGAK